MQQKANPIADPVPVATSIGLNPPSRRSLIAGMPLDEPITQYGPIVMNTKEEIMQAVAHYQAGKFTPAK